MEANYVNNSEFCRLLIMQSLITYQVLTSSVYTKVRKIYVFRENAILMEKYNKEVRVNSSKIFRKNIFGYYKKQWNMATENH